MIDVEHADIDARTAQQVALVLVEMAERGIEINARHHAAAIGELREHRAHHWGHGRIGGALGHFHQR